ncbi:endonuclease/exonuclease/phosphatase family protein [Streptomyces sp. NPDC059166]|uniref:endonuclease/exonuclease/phosphatase family protein n=1 Tax=Streptomyces sp. NPDC059166 TaxID=3346752 RepID=UPI0036B1C539
MRDDAKRPEAEHEPVTGEHDARPGTRRRRPGRLTACLCLLATLLLVLPGLVPDSPGHLGSLLETFLPWLGLAVPAALVAALLRRSRLAAAAALLPAAVWAALFGAALFAGDGAEEGGLLVVQHNVSDVNPDPAATARALARTGADLIALEELTAPALPAYEAALSAGLPHHATVGTVGLWSKHPLVGVRPVDIRPEDVGEGWNRGLRATARTPEGEVAVYVAHLPSVRIGPAGFASGLRDESAVLLARALSSEPLDRVILVGDLNSTLDDRGLAPVTSLMTGPASSFAFSWPAAFPLARIDQVLARSAQVTDIRTLPATTSDHLPVAARVRLRGRGGGAHVHL